MGVQKLSQATVSTGSHGEGSKAKPRGVRASDTDGEATVPQTKGGHCGLRNETIAFPKTLCAEKNTFFAFLEKHGL